MNDGQILLRIEFSPLVQNVSVKDNIDHRRLMTIEKLKSMPSKVMQMVMANRDLPNVDCRLAADDCR